MKKILIVDDNRMNRQILRAMLRKDYELLEAESGEAALEIIRQNADVISAVLLDIVMPGLDGYEVLRQIREDPVLPPVPVIMVTGNEGESAHVKALTLGANDFLMKPYNGDILRHCLLNNITMRENATLVRAAQYDELTGLYNRAGFFKKAEELINEHEPGYYVMASFDLDSFKVVNDQYGTDKGDQVLRYIADTFRRGFEPEGGICCRISADNFAVLYPRRLMDSEKLAGIHREAAAPAGFVMPISFSIGRYIVDDLTLPISAMYDRATLAEESAKGRYGANIALYDESMRRRLLHEQRLVTEMKPALEKGRFEVWLQPQYNHASGALVGAEALVRWRREDGTLVLPGEFIPVFERNGFIYEVDKFIWQQVCSLLRKWLDSGRNPLPVSVNISRSDVFHEDFFDTITGIVKQYRLPVELLRLEITETAFAKATEQIISMVKQLIAYGFTVEIDDFGSGYSSLNTLKDVPADILKLDMKFLENTGDSQRGGNILESVVRMAKWLGMSVIAEGVETREQADYLRSIGCNYVQGYLYARPMPVADYEALAVGHDKERGMITLQTVENLDNNAFWDPKSMDTFIFNSYVGGACIFEYQNGSAELLRTNEAFIRELGISLGADESLSVLDLYQYMDSESRRAANRCVRRAIHTEREFTGEICLNELKGRFDSPQYLRCTLRAIAKAGRRTLLYCVISNITEQRRAEQKERSVSTEMAQLIQDMPGGFMKMCISGTDLIPVFINDELCRISGMTHRQVMELYGADAYAGIHPEDQAQVRKAVAQTVENRSTVSLRASLSNGRGDYVPVQIFYRVTEDGDGNRFLNGYYADITERVSEEEWQKELLDNLPCGAGVYELLDGQLSLTYQNKSYWELVGLGDETFLDPAPMSAIHPEDVPAVMGELKAAMDEGRDVSCDIRLRHLSSGFLPVHLAGRIVPGKAGGFHIFATFTPISNEELAYRELLPLALSAEQMMQDMPGGYAKMRITDTGVVPVYLNDEFCRLTGMSREQAMELYANDAYAGLHPDDLEYAGSVIGGAIADRATVSLSLRFSDGTGGYTPLQVFYRVTEDAGGLYLNGYYTDATVLNRIEEQRRELLENLPCGAGIYEITEAGIRAVYLNKQYRTYLKREITDLNTAPVFEAVHPDDIPGLKKALQRAMSVEKEGSCDICVMDGAGGYILFHLVGRIIERSRGRTAVYVTYTPVTEKELLLHRRAEIDGMTGVYNKMTAETMIRERLSAGGKAPCALLVVDVDNLKAINDTLGHPQGDRAICLVADTLKARFRKTDIIGRIGGDEFVVFLEGAESGEKLESLALGLLKSLSDADGAEELKVRVSIGIAASVGASFDELYERADRALYRAKENGKNQFAVCPEDKE